MPPQSRPETAIPSLLPAGIASFFDRFASGDRYGPATVSTGTGRHGPPGDPRPRPAWLKSALWISGEPLPASLMTDPAGQGGLAAPLVGSIATAPRPPGGGHGGARGGSSRPAGHRPSTKEWCPATSGQIFSRREEQFGTKTLEEWSIFHPWLPKPSLKPGTGFSSADCGKWVLTAGCEDRTHPVTVIRHSCKTLQCPKCWTDYVTDKARDVEERFGLYEQAKLAKNSRLIPGEKCGIKPRHFVFTISPAKRDQLIQKTLAKTGGWFDAVPFLDILREEFDQCWYESGLLGGRSLHGSVD